MYSQEGQRALPQDTICLDKIPLLETRHDWSRRFLCTMCLVLLVVSSCMEPNTTKCHKHPEANHIGYNKI